MQRTLKMNKVRTHVFERSGLASVADLAAPQALSLFHMLEEENRRFLSMEERFRSQGYQWPREPLYCWSRKWEYPYVYHNLQRLLIENRPPIATTRVLDLGSGVTFFPFAVARLGIEVHCYDIDPICEHDMNLAIKFVDATPGTVSYVGGDGTSLPFQDETLDAVYCISVLEHANNPVALIDEIHRVLRVDGLALITVDLESGGGCELDPRGLERIRAAIDRKFTLFLPEMTLHPDDVL